MSVMGKLMFWKKEPDISAEKGFDFGGGLGESKEIGFGINKDALGLGKDMTAGMGGTGDLSSPMGFEKDVNLRGPGFEHVEEPTPLRSAPLEKKPMYYQEVAPPSPYGPYPQQQRDVSKDIEIISAKLDSIKTMLDMLNHKIDAMERQQGKRGRMEW